MEKKRKWTVPILTGLLVILAATVFVIFKLGQSTLESEKWGDYDDCGWA